MNVTISLVWPLVIGTLVLGWFLIRKALIKDMRKNTQYSADDPVEKIGESAEYLFKLYESSFATFFFLRKKVKFWVTSDLNKIAFNFAELLTTNKSFIAAPALRKIIDNFMKHSVGNPKTRKIQEYLVGRIKEYLFEFTCGHAFLDASDQIVQSFPKELGGIQTRINYLKEAVNTLTVLVSRVGSTDVLRDLLATARKNHDTLLLESYQEKWNKKELTSITLNLDTLFKELYTPEVRKQLKDRLDSKILGNDFLSDAITDAKSVMSMA